MGLRIKILRQLKDINQAELGKIIGVGKTTISNYETGYSFPDLETLIKLADYFSVSTDYLLGRTDYREMSSDRNVNNINSLSENEIELLQIFKRVDNEREQIKLLGRFGEIVEQMTSNFKSNDVPSTPSEKNVG